MRQAMRFSTARSPHVVVAHGEGGVRSDRLEAAALDLLAPGCVTSLQPFVGHTMSACGPVNLAAACLMLADQRVPAIPTLESPEMNLPFAIEEVRGPVANALVNALEPDNTAASAFITPL
jgi:3-oxoacyl-(acyl-carrier-protein) synthase